MSKQSPAWTVPVTLAVTVVAGLRTTTMTEPSTAAFELEPPTSRASSWKFSVEAAFTSIPPPVVMVVLS